MFGISWNVWVAIGGGLLLVIWQVWPSISSLASKIKLPGFATASPATDRSKAVESVDYLIAFFKDCPEGRKAAQTCGQHLFDDHAGGSA